MGEFLMATHSAKPMITVNWAFSMLNKLEHTSFLWRECPHPVNVKDNRHSPWVSQVEASTFLWIVRHPGVSTLHTQMTQSCSSAFQQLNPTLLKKKCTVQKSNKNAGSKLGHFSLDSMIQGNVFHFQLSQMNSFVQDPAIRMVSEIYHAWSVWSYCEPPFLGDLGEILETCVWRAPISMFLQSDSSPIELPVILP